MNDSVLREKIKSIVNRVATDESPYDLLSEIAGLLCHEDDTFDFKTGAKIAFERLMGTYEASEPKYLNGKVVCTRSPYSWLTVGKVYNVVDGIIKDDGGDEYPSKGYEPYRTYEDILHAGLGKDHRHDLYNDFIEFKGE